GARFDFYLEGPVTGPKVQGTFKGIDYIYFRADGRAELHIHGEITTNDGKKIALEAGGVAIPEEGSPVFQLREHVSLMSNRPEVSDSDIEEAAYPIWVTGRLQDDGWLVVGRAAADVDDDPAVGERDVRRLTPADRLAG